MSFKEIQKAISQIEDGSPVSRERIQSLREKTALRFANAKAEAELCNHLLYLAKETNLEPIKT